MSDLAPGTSRGLSRETLERLSREWDRRVGTGPHSISAEKTRGGENIIFVFEGEALDTSGDNPYAEELLHYFGEVITEDEMNNDLPD